MEIKPVRKRINFYQLQGEYVHDKKASTLTVKEIEDYLESIYAKLKVNKNNYKYKKFEVGPNEYIIEFIKFDRSILFARIGKRTNEYTIGKRDSVTGNLLNIELEDNENIESYTYLHLDLNNMILSYLVLSGTPSKTSFSYFINGMVEGVNFECVPITTEDVLKNLAGKSILGTIEFSYCNPKENVMKNIPGLDKKSLENLNADKTMVTVSLRPPRSKSITDKIKHILTIKENLIKEHGENLKSLRMNARDYEEETINYNLLDYKFASYTLISMILIKTEEDFYDIISNEYKKMKKVLEDFIK